MKVLEWDRHKKVDGLNPVNGIPVHPSWYLDIQYSTTLGSL